MSMSGRSVTRWCLAALWILVGWACAHAQIEGSPWLNPQFGTTTTIQDTSGTGGYDRIEQVISQGGQTTDNGAVVSNSGTTPHTTYVNNALNAAAAAIGGSAGSAWAWSWSWSMDANGNMVQSWHRGDLNLTGTKTDTAPTGPGNPTDPAGPGSPGSPPGGPIVPVSPAGNAGSANPATPGVPALTFNPTAPPTTDITAPAPIAAPIDISVPSVPAPLAILTVLDQVNQNEQYVASLSQVRLPRPIPEDVRTRFGLEIPDPNVDPKNVTVQLFERNEPIIDAKSAFELGGTLQYTFRTPSDTDYRAVVIHNDPASGACRLIDVVIPVTPVTMRAKSIDSQEHRQHSPEDWSAPPGTP